MAIHGTLVRLLLVLFVANRLMAVPPATEDPVDVFFDNALEEGLVGERPARLGSPTSHRVMSEEDADSKPMKKATWSRWISAETIEDTVKSLRYELDQSVKQPAQFAADGSKAARRQFTMLACLFAIIHEYDGTVRWKQDAWAARDRCATAASERNDLEAFEVAQQARNEIANLIRGGSMEAVTDLGARRWDQIADRRPLMQQLDASLRTVLRPSTATPAAFREHADGLAKQAELTAVIAEILTREAMEDATEEDYVAYCRTVQAATQSLLDALQKQDAAAGSAAVGRISQSCNRCHEDYRG